MAAYPHPSPRPVEDPFRRFRPGVVLPVVLAMAGGCVAWFVVAMLPLGFYGDEDIPSGFTGSYTSFFDTSMFVTGGVVVALLAAGIALAADRRSAARVTCRLCLAFAPLLPWVWVAVAVRLAGHWYDVSR